MIFQLNRLSQWERPWLHRKNGNYKCPKKKVVKWFTEPHKTIHSVTVGARTKIALTVFNPGSRTHIKIWLKRLFDIDSHYFTPAGNPKWSADVFEELAEVEGDEHVKDSLLSMKRYLKNVKDSGFLHQGDNALLRLYNPDTGAIHGRVDTLGTGTARATHSKPNMSQTPKAKEYRELFTAPEGYVVVGADQAALEVRTLAHYLYKYDNGEYIDVVLNKDVHTHNQEKAGLPTRSDAKVFFFAFLYGSGAVVRGVSLWSPEVESTLEYKPKERENIVKSIENRALIINDKKYYPLKKDLMVEVNELLVLQGIYGAQVGQRFKDELVGLKELIEELSDYAEDKGHILSVDGREIECSAGRYGLNYCLQSSGSIIVKQCMVNIQDSLNATGMIYGIDYWQSGYYHDEVAFTVKKEHSETVRKILEEASTPLQEQFGLHLPFVAEGLIGDSWYDVH